MENKQQLGMIGLGTMGSNLVLNMCDKGFSVAGYDQNETKVSELLASANGKMLTATTNIDSFINSLQLPRVIMMLVPAGKIVDAVIADLLPHLQPDDIIIDCGNSHFTDTQLRVTNLAKSNIHFMGIGISGGETGARFGPSIMPGGDRKAYQVIAPVLEAIAAKVDEKPCTAYMGNGAAGHYVKMVHNGIEYAIMQLLAETYHILKVHGGLNNKALHDVYTKWDAGRLKSYLVQITAAIFLQQDEITGNGLIDMIADTAKQKGTGAWTSEDAMKLPSPIPTIDAAVTQRIISSLKKERVVAAAHFNTHNAAEQAANTETLINDVEQALYAGFIITFAQGMALLQKASAAYEFGINLSTVAAIWRGGCIVRANELNSISDVLNEENELHNLLLSSYFSSEISAAEPALRRTVVRSIQQGIPVPALSACINYKDSYCSPWLPANLIQAQRDFFGAHSYERIDKQGTFHTDWNETIQ